MSFIKYVYDKAYMILFTVFLMVFISTVVYLDGSIKVNFSNIIYINVVAFSFLALYIIVGYLRKNRYFNLLTEVIEKKMDYPVSLFPKPLTCEQRLFHRLIENMCLNNNEKREKLIADKKENTDFVTSWVHEIKTPIAVSRLIMENTDGKDIDEIIKSLRDEMDKIDDYVEQSLYYSKLDSFSKDYFIKETEIDKIVKDAVKKHAKIFINKKISVELNNTDFLATTDKKWLNYIIDQILTNSLKYTDVGGSIKINGFEDNHEKRLVIEDNGIGIKPEDISRVFDKGFTGTNGRTMQKSTGIGLYLAKNLAKKLGHDITIESTYNQYTKVTIHFPNISDYYSTAQ